jgi:hypothetical protein
VYSVNAVTRGEVVIDRLAFESLPDVSALLGAYAGAVDAVWGRDGGRVNGISVADNGQLK